MSFDNRYLTLKAAGRHIGCTTRWLRRHYVNLVKEGVEVYRVPKGSPKGRLLFSKASLEVYLQKCQLKF